MAISQRFTTIDEQIEILKYRGLIIDDEASAKNLLEHFGYYNIINSYKDPFVISYENDEYYKQGITFDRLYSLFCFDHVLRNELMVVLLQLEEHLKAIAAYVIAESFTSNQYEYLRYSNYVNRRVSAPQFRLRSILDTLSYTTGSNKDPIKHHRERYGNVPPWVLFKSVYFSTMVNFVRLFKNEQKSAVISKIYGIPFSDILDNPYIRRLFSDTLFLCVEYRNLCAHGGRVYNYHPSNSIGINNESIETLTPMFDNYSFLVSSHSIGRLIFALSFFKEKAYYKTLINTIKIALESHTKSFPEDRNYLIDTLGLGMLLN